MGEWMVMDSLEKEHLRRKMAFKMGVFLEEETSVSCVSGHFYVEPHFCDLCQQTHADEVLVIKNRSAKKMIVAVPCLMEMVRFRVAEVEELPRWLAKISELRVGTEKRKEESRRLREEERKKLEKKVIVRKRHPQENIS